MTRLVVYSLGFVNIGMIIRVMFLTELEDVNNIEQHIVKCFKVI